MSWHDLGPLDLTNPVCVQVAGREIAVFAVADEFFALANSCPHQGGPLVDGVVQKGHVSCPWHGWRFEFGTGRCTTLERDSTQAYRVRRTGDRFEIEVP